MSNIAIVIPTYNASGGILKLLSRISALVPSAQIFVIDDNSPDRTAELVKKKFGNNKRITVLVRKGKEGRGSAVMYGFKTALKDKNTHYFIEMDADLCHNPKYIPLMIEKGKKADVVIASKYVKGSVVSGLSFKRKIMSRVMNTAARIILQVPISDFSNGFRCYNRSVIEFITKQKLQAKGFVSLSETIYLIYKKGFIISEIPFDFNQKKRVASNLNLREIAEAVWILSKLRL